MNPETIKPIVANRFADYETAHAYYNGTIVPKYGAIRHPWGFDRWLYLPAFAFDAEGIALWTLLDSIGILTNEGARRLAKALTTAAKNGGAK